MSVPGFTDLGPGDEQAPTPESVVASVLGFTEQENGPAFVPAPPPPPPVQQVYDPWSDEATNTTPAPAYEPPPPPVATGVDYFGLDDATAYQGDPNGPIRDYVTDAEMFGLPEMGMQPSGVDFFQMQTSAPGLYLPQQPEPTPIDQILVSLRESEELMSTITTRLDKIAGVITDGNPDPTSELGLAISTGDYAKAEALIAEYEQLLDKLTPIHDGYQTSVNQVQSLFARRDAGRWNFSSDQTGYGLLTPGQQIGSLQGGMGYAALPNPIGVMDLGQKHELRAQWELDQQHTAAFKWISEQEIAKTIYDQLSPTDQMQTLADTLSIIHPNAPERMLFGDSFVPLSNQPGYFKRSDIAIDERDRFRRVGDDLLATGIPYDKGSAFDQLTTGLGYAAKGLGVAVTTSGLLPIKRGLGIVSPSLADIIPDISLADVGKFSWTNGGKQVWEGFIASSESGARTAYTLYATVPDITGHVEQWVRNLEDFTKRQLTPGQQAQSIEEVGQQAQWAGLDEKYDLDAATLRRTYIDDYNQLHPLLRLGMEATLDPWGPLLIGPALPLIPLKVAKTAINARRAVRVAEEYQGLVTKGFVTAGDIENFYAATGGPNPAELRNIRRLATTYAGKLIEDGRIIKDPNPDRAIALAHAIGFKSAIKHVTVGNTTGFDNVQLAKMEYDILIDARRFAVDVMGWTPEQATAQIKIDASILEPWAQDMSVVVDQLRSQDSVLARIERERDARGAQDTLDQNLSIGGSPGPLGVGNLPLPPGVTPGPPRSAMPLERLNDEQRKWLNLFSYNVTQGRKRLDAVVATGTLSEADVRILNRRLATLNKLVVQMHLNGAANLQGTMPRLDQTLVEFQELADEYLLAVKNMGTVSNRMESLPRGRGRKGLSYQRDEEQVAIINSFTERFAALEKKLAEGIHDLRRATVREPILPEVKEAWNADLNRPLLMEIERLSRDYGQNFWAVIKAEGGGAITNEVALQWLGRFKAAETKGATDAQLKLLHQVYSALDGHAADPMTPRGRWADQVEQFLEQGTKSEINELIRQLRTGEAVAGREPLIMMTQDEFLTTHGDAILKLDGEYATYEDITKRDAFRKAGYEPFHRDSPATRNQIQHLWSLGRQHERDYLAEFSKGPILYGRADKIINDAPITLKQRAMLDSLFREGMVTKSEFDEFSKMTVKQFQTRTDVGRDVDPRTGKPTFSNKNSPLLRKRSGSQAAVNALFIGNWDMTEAQIRENLYVSIASLLPGFRLENDMVTLTPVATGMKLIGFDAADEPQQVAIGMAEFVAFISKRKLPTRQWWSRTMQDLIDLHQNPKIPDFDVASPSTIPPYQHVIEGLLEIMRSDRTGLDELDSFVAFMEKTYGQSQSWKRPLPEKLPNPFLDKGLDEGLERLRDGYHRWISVSGSNKREYDQLHEQFREEYVERTKVLTEAQLPEVPPNKRDARSWVQTDNLEEIKNSLEARGIDVTRLADDDDLADVTALLIHRMQNLDFIPVRFEEDVSVPPVDLTPPVVAPTAPAELIGHYNDGRVKWQALDRVGVDAYTGSPASSMADKAVALSNKANRDSLNIYVNEGGIWKKVPHSRFRRYDEEALGQVFDEGFLLLRNGVQAPVGMTFDDAVASLRKADETPRPPTPTGEPAPTPPTTPAPPPPPPMHPDPTIAAGPMMVDEGGRRTAWLDTIRMQVQPGAGWTKAETATSIAMTDMMALRLKADGLIESTDSFYDFNLKYIDAVSGYKRWGSYVRAIPGGERRADVLGDQILNTTVGTADPKPIIYLFKAPKSGDTPKKAVVAYLHEAFHHFVDFLPDTQAKALWQAANPGVNMDNWTREMMHAKEADEVLAQYFESYIDLIGDPDKLSKKFAPFEIQALDAIRKVIADIWKRVAPYLTVFEMPPASKQWFNDVFGDFSINVAGQTVLKSPRQTLPVSDLPPGPSRILTLRHEDLLRTRAELDREFNELSQVVHTDETAQTELLARRDEINRALKKTTDEIERFKAQAPAETPAEPTPDIVSERKQTAIEQMAAAAEYRKTKPDRYWSFGRHALKNGEFKAADYDAEIARLYSYDEYVPSFMQMMRINEQVGVTRAGWLDWGARKALRWDQWTKATQITKVTDVIGTLVRTLVDEAYTDHQGDEYEFIMRELETAALDGDFTTIMQRLPGSTDSKEMQAALRTISRHLGKARSDENGLLGKIEQYFPHISFTKGAVGLLPERSGAWSADDLAGLDDLIMGKARFADWSDEQWAAAKVYRERFKDDWVEGRLQFRNTKGDWRSNVSSRELDIALGTLDPFQPAMAEDFVENIATAIGAQEAIRIGYDPDAIPTQLKLMMAVKNQYAPFWLSLNPIYHVNNMVGNLSAWLFGQLRTDVGGSMRAGKKARRVMEQFGAGGGDPYLHNYGQYTVRPGYSKPLGRLRGEEQTLRRVRKGSLRERLTADDLQPFSPYSEGRGLRRELATAMGKPARNKTLGSSNPWWERSWANVGGFKQVVGFANAPSAYGEQGFRRAIYAGAWEHRYNTDWYKAINEIDLPDDARFALREVAGHVELRDAMREWGITGVTRDDLVARQRKVLANARFEGYEAAKTMLRDYRMRNRLDGVLDQVFPIHFWAQKNALFVGQTFLQRPNLIPLAIGAHQEWIESRAHLPAHLRAMHVGPIDLSGVLGEHAPAPFHLRLTNFTNPAFSTLPKLLDRDKWDLDADAGAREILNNIGRLPQNLYESFGFRVGPHLDGAGRLAQVLLGKTRFADSALAENLAQFSDWLANPNGYRSEIIPYQATLTANASRVPKAGDELRAGLIWLDSMTTDGGFTRKEWIYAVEPALADIGDAKGWSAEYRIAVLNEMKGGEPVVPAWISGETAATWAQNVERDAAYVRDETYRRAGARSASFRFGYQGLGVREETITRVDEARREFARILREQTTGEARQATIDYFKQSWVQKKYAMDDWIPLFEAWLAEGNGHFGGLFADPAESLKRVKEGDLSDPLFLLFAQFALTEGQIAAKNGPRDPEAGALNLAWQTLQKWQSQRTGRAFDAAYLEILGEPDANGEHRGGPYVNLLATFAASDDWEEIRDQLMGINRGWEYDQTRAMTEHIDVIMAAEREQRIEMQSEVYTAWKPYFEERERIEEAYTACINGSGGNMANQYACHATRGRTIGEWSERTKAMVTEGSLPDIGDLRKWYPSFPYRSDLENRVQPGPYTQARTPQSAEQAARWEFEKRAFMALDPTAQQDTLELAGAQDQRGYLIDNLLEHVGLSHYVDGKENPEFMVGVDVDEDGEIDYEVFDWDAYHEAVADAWADQVAPDGTITYGLGTKYRTIVAETQRELRELGGTLYLHSQPEFAQLTEDDLLYHTRNKNAVYTEFRKEGKEATDAWYEARKANDDWGSPIADAERLAITQQYGSSIWGNRDLSGEGLIHTQYKEGIRLVSDLYYSMTPADKLAFQERFPDLFVDVENPPDSKNPGITHPEFTKENLTTADMTSILREHGYEWGTFSTDELAQEEWTLAASDPETRTGEIERVNEATKVEALIDQSKTVALSEDQQNRLQQWQDYTSNPLEAAAKAQLESNGEFFHRSSGETRSSWGLVEEHLADLLSKTDPNSDEYGDVNALIEYVRRRRELSAELNIGEVHDAQAAWFNTLDADTQDLLLEEAPSYFSLMTDKELTSGGSAGPDTSSGGGGGGGSSSAPRSSSARSSSAPRSSSSGGSSSYPRSGTPTSTTTGQTSRALPALVALDPGLRDGPDVGERMVYATQVSDWFDRYIFPLVQLAPNGQWRNWMQWLTMAGVAMVRSRLGDAPTLETWRLLAEELVGIDPSLTEETLRSGMRARGMQQRPMQAGYGFGDSPEIAAD